MKWMLLFLLVACAAQPLEPAIPNPSPLVFVNTCTPHDLGAACIQNCDCLKPTTCVSAICSLTNLADKELCHANAQCQSGYCTETGFCSRPDSPKGNYDCDKVCKGSYTQENCYTVCKYR